jgi:stage V sporulation protein AC
MEINKQAYDEYVKEVTPVHNKGLNIVKAFLVGGIICTYGQVLNTWLTSTGLDKETAASWTTLILIATSVILTGLNLYQKLVKFGGAGALVPITGFANSVVAPAVEFQAEGQVFGIGCKIFTIAGPVILYGIFSSWLLGVLAYVLKAFGII